MSQNVNVNLTPGGYPKEFHVSQYDVGRQLVAKVVDSTGDYSIPSGATIVLVGTKPSGFGFTLNGTVSGSTVTFSTTATVTAEYGRIPCELRITSGSTILGTANCMLIVEKSPHPEGTTDGDGEVIVNQITLLLEQITQQADRAVAASEAAQASETAAAASEANAATSESNAAASEATALSAKDDAVAAKTAAQASEQAAAESAAEAEATLGSYAKVSGEYDGMTVGTAKQLLSDSTTTDTEPYIYRQTAGDADREEVEVVGGTVAWNQLVQNGNFESTSGWEKAGGNITAANNCLTFTITSPSNENAVFTRVDPIIGHRYLVTCKVKASANTHARYRFGMAYSPVSAVSGNSAAFISSVLSPTQNNNALILYCNNQTELASGATVSYEGFALHDLTAMFNPQVADAVYAMEQSSAGAGVAWCKQFPMFNKYSPYNAGELMSVKTSAHVTVGFNQWDEEWEVGSINGGNGANLADNTRVRSKNLCRCLPNVTYARRITPGYGLNVFWYDASEGFISYTAGSDMSGVSIVTAPDNACYFRVATTSGYGNVYNHDICINISDPSKNGTYEPYSAHTYPLSPIDLRGIPQWVDGKLAFDGDIYPPSGEVQRRYGLRAYQSGDESLADAITDGSHTVYKLTTPTTETADPYTAIQVCDPNGTEEWTDERTVQIPVGNVTKYHANLKEKLEDLPAIPSAPSANGTYTLKATVSDGAVTYQWVNG